MRDIIFRSVQFWFLLLLISPAVVAQDIPAFPPAQLGFSEERLDRIRKVIERHIIDGTITGAVTLIARQGRIAHLGAFGNIDGDPSRPMHPNTMFRVASMTKPVTAVAALMLYEQGRYLLDDPVHHYIPEFRDLQVLKPAAVDATSTEPVRRPINIRHLLNHTSGFTYRGFGHPVLADLYKEAGIQEGNSFTTESVGDAIKRLVQIPLQFQPGEQWQYGLSIDVLGFLIETVHETDLENVFRTEIFKPLGMTDSYFYPPEQELGRIADFQYPLPANADKEAGWYTPVGDYFKAPRSYMSGGSGLVTTVIDYWRFCQNAA